jgi:hypothetical protein
VLTPSRSGGGWRDPALEGSLILLVFAIGIECRYFGRSSLTTFCEAAGGSVSFDRLTL